MKNRRQSRSALVVGLGRFGSATAQRLTTLGWEVVGVDKDPDVIEARKDQMAHVVQLDASDEEALGTVGVPDFEVCIVSRGESIESSLLLVLNLQHLGARRIVAKATSEHHARILRRIGTQDIIFPEIDAGARLAENLQAPHLAQWMSVGDQILAMVRVPKGRSGCPLDNWQASRRPTLQLLSHLTSDGRNLTIDRHAPLQEGEILVVLGSPEDVLALGE